MNATESNMSEPEVEALLRRTFQAVSDQTEASPAVGAQNPFGSAEVAGRQVPTGRSELDGADTAAVSDSIVVLDDVSSREAARGRRTSRWLAVAAAAAVLVVGGVAVASSTGNNLDTNSATDASSPDNGDGTNGSETTGSDQAIPKSGGPGPVYLLPPNVAELTPELEFSELAESDREQALSRLVIARPTDDGYADLMTVLLADADPGWFSVDAEESTEVAGRTLYNSFDEGVAERTDDGRWIVYQTEFGAPTLEAVVAGVTIEDDRLRFDGSGGELVSVAAAVDGPVRYQTSVEHLTEHPTAAIVPFRLATLAVADPALLEAEMLQAMADLWVPSVRRASVDGRPAFVASIAEEGFEAGMVSWVIDDGHVASMMAFGLTEPELLAFAEGFEEVDAGTWSATLQEGATGTDEREDASDEPTYLLPTDLDLQAGDSLSLEVIASAPFDELEVIVVGRAIGTAGDLAEIATIGLGPSPFPPDSSVEPTTLISGRALYQITDDVWVELLVDPEASIEDTSPGDDPEVLDDPVVGVRIKPEAITYRIKSPEADLADLVNSITAVENHLEFASEGSGLTLVTMLDVSGGSIPLVTISYQPEEPDASRPAFDLIVGTFEFSDAELGFASLEFGAHQFTTTRVGDGPGRVFTEQDNNGDRTVVVWPVADGTAAILEVRGSVDEALALASSFELVDKSRWDAAVEESTQ